MKPRLKFIVYSSHLIRVVAAALLSFGVDASARAENVSDFPAAETLEAGDLIWPKKPGALVPYNSEPGGAEKSDAQRWLKEKKAYLSHLRDTRSLTAEERRRYSALQNMTYKEFIDQYIHNRSPGEVTNFGSGGVSVGHVGIVQIVNGNRHVVEAMMGTGVQLISYREWLHTRAGEQIWVGRLRGVSAQNRAAVAMAAMKYVKQPYNFWNFDLEDTTGFYCSKLAWLSILTGAGFAPDDNRDSHRILWYSPKQLMHSKHVELIVNPGSYGSKQ